MELSPETSTLNRLNNKPQPIQGCMEQNREEENERNNGMG